MMGPRVSLGWTWYDLPSFGESQRRAPRPRCGARLVSGSHVACCLRPEHDGPHESEDGEAWEDK